MCTTPTSNVNHTVMKTVLLFSSKRCEQLIYHLLPQNWSLFFRLSNPLATRKFCMVKGLNQWVIWAGSYLSNLGSLAFHPRLWIKTNWQWLRPFCWHIMYHWRTSPYYSVEGLHFHLFSPRQATVDTSEAARRLCWSLIAPAITARAVWTWGLPLGPTWKQHSSRRWWQHSSSREGGNTGRSLPREGRALRG